MQGVQPAFLNHTETPQASCSETPIRSTTPIGKKVMALLLTNQQRSRKNVEHAIDKWLTENDHLDEFKNYLKKTIVDAFDSQETELPVELLQRKKLLSIPPLHDFIYLKEIDFSHQGITHIEGDAFQSLKNLVKLNLESNEIRVVSNLDLSDHTALEEVNFQKNDMLEMTNANFSSCTKLRKLKLMANFFIVFSNIYLTDCRELQSFSLDHMPKLRTMDNILFSGCIHLKNINLSFNQASEYGYFNFNQCEELESIQLKGNKLESFPSWDLTPCIKLSSLDLSMNLFKASKELLLSNLEQLNSLDISENLLIELDEVIQYLSEHPHPPMIQAGRNRFSDQYTNDQLIIQKQDDYSGPICYF